jgi:hypothetical protein
LGVALLLSAWAASTFLPRHPRQSLVAAMPTNRPAVSPKPPPEPVVKPITDEELLALFPDRAVVLIGKPGQQEFVVLGAPAQN